MSPQETCVVFVLLMAALLLCAGCTQPATNAPAPAAGSPAVPVAQPASADHVRLVTTMGNITLALDPDMPVTTGHFEALVKKGFYDNVNFHRVISGFMIQGGDPTGTGTGGSGPGFSRAAIPDEFTAHNRNDRGTIAMANAGPNTGDAQFFINLVNNNYLDTRHPVFGTVIEGMDVVDAIGKVPTTGGQTNRPLRNVTILHAEMV